MEQTAVSDLKRTPLHARHLAHGARMVPFGGWAMPVEYTGIVEEHLAVRTRAGLFDVSHMGQIEIAGDRALDAVQHLCSNDASRLKIGQAQYSALTTPEGCFVDDLLVYRMGPGHFLFVVNAGNIEKDYAWISAQVSSFGDVGAVNSSARYALLAVQGPLALQIVQTLTAIDLAALRYYWFAHGEVAGIRAMVSRTGYTGEDGFEIFAPPQAADRLWNTIIEAGRSSGLVPVGLGARDTLRLEAAMRLYGNDIDETTTVLEADLGWIIGWQKPSFTGRDALAAQKERGVDRRLVGLELLDRAIARHGYDVLTEDAKVGAITSGTQTPFLKKAIALAYVRADLATDGTMLAVDVRGRRARAQVVPLPFYKRPKR
jgi:aminomethyltransferase